MNQSDSTDFLNPYPVPEGVGWRYQGTLRDEDGNVIPAASFSALTVKIWNMDAALTNIQAQTSILNTGRGVLDSNGVLTVKFVPTDSALVDTTKNEERHRALIEGDYSGTKKYARRITWRVTNFENR